MPTILVPYPAPDYVAALERAGADVRTVDAATPVDAALEGVDGVLLTGGADIDPSLYNTARHPATKDAQPGRDAYELELASRAMATDMPLLAICRGVQVLNVAAGGTLVQDLPSERPDTDVHDITEPRDAEAHAVRVTPGTTLARVLATEVDSDGTTRVNSRHHQALDTVAEGMHVTAVSPDGVIEAIEKPGARFCVGVQWHPENFHRTGRFAGLFEHFVRAAGHAPAAAGAGRADADR